MMKTMRNKRRNERERFKIPKSTRDIIPISNILDDGLFIVGKNKYSKTFKFTDINYAVASKEDKEALFLEYSELLNSFDSGASSKLTIINRRLSRSDFEVNILMSLKGDGLDKYRQEYNRMLMDKAMEANAIVQDKYVTISITKANILEARSYFSRVGSGLIAHFARLGSKCSELNANERLLWFDYVNWYNNVRIHGSLGYKSPAEY